MNGIELITKERKRQIDRKGHTAKKDDGYRRDQLALAAVCYVSPEPIFTKRNLSDGKGTEVQYIFTDPWPWHRAWDKRTKHSRIHQLEIAGALIAAEIDRLLRTELGEKL